MKDRKEWDIYIEPKSNLFQFKLGEVWKYRYLIVMFVKRDFVSVYKQTILGPLWFIIQPVITIGIFFFVFNNIAHISTDGLPPVLFYMSGILFWNYFSTSFLKTADTFSANAGVFGKVYFPRLTVPISTVFSALISFAIQAVLFIGIYVYFILTGYEPVLNPIAILVVPYLIVLITTLSLGMGIIIAALTTKYRDLRFLVAFGIQLLMYATPVVYPISIVTNERMKMILNLNPMTGILEAFRWVVFASGAEALNGLVYSSASTAILLIIGIALFNKVEKNFMDTI